MRITTKKSWVSFNQEVVLLHKKVLELQLPGKKVVNATAFWNGLRGQKLKKL